MLLDTFLACQVAVQNKFLQAKNTRSDVTVVSSSEFSENANSFFRKFVSRTIFIRSCFLPSAPLLFVALFFSKCQKGASYSRSFGTRKKYKPTASGVPLRSGLGELESIYFLFSIQYPLFRHANKLFTKTVLTLTIVGGSVVGTNLIL